MSKVNSVWNVLDLFSGAGGMSYGFHAHPRFRVIGAVDAQNGKPSSGKGSLECNKTYEANIGIPVLEADIGDVSESALRNYLLGESGTDKIDILISCAPCTGFSRTIRKNLVEDDPRNSLVVKSADFVRWFSPKIFIMENVGELLSGKFSYHFLKLKEELEDLGYIVSSDTHSLDKYGLPQTRKRALIIATKKPLAPKLLDELWKGYKVNYRATSVKAAIGDMPKLNAGEMDAEDNLHVSPAFTESTLKRLKLIPKNGGSWPDLLKKPGGEALLIPSMKKYVDQGKVGPHPDVYGRMSWDKPAVTIKRECSHTGNGRYAHPEQNRLCTVREMAILQGFPKTYKFKGSSLSNMYRHIGDSVPPLISYQLAYLCQWIMTNRKPNIKNIILPNSHLKITDIEEIQNHSQFELVV